MQNTISHVLETHLAFTFFPRTLHLLYFAFASFLLFQLFVFRLLLWILSFDARSQLTQLSNSALHLSWVLNWANLRNSKIKTHSLESFKFEKHLKLIINWKLWFRFDDNPDPALIWNPFLAFFGSFAISDICAHSLLLTRTPEYQIKVISGSIKSSWLGLMCSSCLW